MEVLPHKLPHTQRHTPHTQPRRCFYSLFIATMKTTTIKGTAYTFKKFEPVINGKTSIFDLYTKPSQEKIKAFFEREKKLEGIYWLIGGSHNFSIYWYVIDENGKRHEVKITKQNNYIID